MHGVEGILHGYIPFLTSVYINNFNEILFRCQKFVHAVINQLPIDSLGYKLLSSQSFSSILSLNSINSSSSFLSGLNNLPTSGNHVNDVNESFQNPIGKYSFMIVD